MSCFVVGSMKGLTNTQLIMYNQAASTFRRIQAYDANIRSQRLAGNKSVSYYTFQEGEKALYTMGQFLLNQNDPNNSPNYQDVVKI
jgi:hypothetical protein